jgi:ABC-type glycerol-3-phosphate transport system permease component
VWNDLLVALVFSMTLPMLVCFGLQRYFVCGLLAGAVKG